MHLSKEVKLLQESYKLTDYEALDIALKKEYINLYRQANVLIKDGTETPSALEKIAIELADIKLSI